jgi:hypothetical protein
MPESLDVQPFQLEHVRARKHSGRTMLANLAWSCLPCNSYKGANVAGFDPETDSLEPLFNPRHDTWKDHFVWEAATLVGLTAIGRATIDVLRINRSERLLHRQLLLASGRSLPG